MAGNNTTLAELITALSELRHTEDLVFHALQQAERALPTEDGAADNVSKAIAALRHVFEEKAQALEKLSASRAPESLRDQHIKMRTEWEGDGRKFRPRTHIEQEIWSGFHALKARGFRFIAVYGDKGDNESYTIGGLTPQEEPEAPEDAVLCCEDIAKIVQRANKTLMALLVSDMAFEDQWPYIPGAITEPVQLVLNPVISIPPDITENPDFKPLSPHRGRSLIMGTIEGGRPDAPEA